MPVMKAGSNTDDSISFCGVDFGCFTPTINHICYTFQHYLLNYMKKLADVAEELQEREGEE